MKRVLKPESEFVSTSTSSGHDFAYNKYYMLHYKFPDPQCNACGATRYVHAKHILLPRHIVNVIYSHRCSISTVYSRLFASAIFKKKKNIM